MAQAFSASDESALAHSLTQARASGIGAPPHADSLVLDEAYRVQAAVFAQSGDALAGYKLAATSARAQAAMELDGPLVGLIGASQVVDGIVPPTPHAQPIYAEAELLLRIGHDLPVFTSHPALDHLAQAIDSVWGAIEICASRFADDDLSAPGIVADNALLHTIVRGDLLAAHWHEDLAQLDVTLEPEGAEPVLGSASAVMGHPLLAISALAVWLGARSQHLQAGQIIACGSMTGITQIDPQARVIARFGPLGTARATLATHTTRSTV